MYGGLFSLLLLALLALWIITKVAREHRCLADTVEKLLREAPSVDSRLVRLLPVLSRSTTYERVDGRYRPLRHGFRSFSTVSAGNDYPPDLGRAALVMSEIELAIDRPMRLVGKPDEVYLHPDGYLVPVETKTRDRARVHADDRIRLSVYAVLLRHARYARLPARPGRAVADYGYVRLVTPKGTLWKVTNLLSEADVARLVGRRIELEQGRARSRPAHHPSLCRRCPYRSGCPQRQG